MQDPIFDRAAPAAGDSPPPMPPPINEANWAPAPSSTVEEVLNTLFVAPGDQVILFVRGPLSMAQADDMRQRLTEKHPDVKWTIVDGIAQVLKIPGGGR